LSRTLCCYWIVQWTWAQWNGSEHAQEKWCLYSQCLLSLDLCLTSFCSRHRTTLEPTTFACVSVVSFNFKAQWLFLFIAPIW
jgi:hypothetical protein